jgi:hypothetical protein
VSSFQVNRVCSSLCIRDQVSQSYKTIISTAKHKILCILGQWKEVPPLVEMIAHNAFFFLSAGYSPPAYANQPKGLVSSEGYRVIITTNISRNRMVRRLEGNMQQYEERGSARARGRLGGGGTSIRVFPWPQCSLYTQYYRNKYRKLDSEYYGSKQ